MVFSIEFCLYLFSPDPIGKVSESFKQKCGRPIFSRGPTEERKERPDPDFGRAATEGAADSEAASRLRICSDRLHAIQLELRAHLLHLRRQLLDCSLLLRDCRLQFCDPLFLRFAGDESRGRPENPFEKARKRIATLRADRGDFDQHIVGQAVTVRIGG